MPVSAPRPCSHPGCSVLVKAGRCELHHKAQRKVQDERRDRGPRFYDKRRWRDRIRPAQLSRYPLCEVCQAVGKVVVATDVDHIDGNTSNNGPDNLMSLCHSCHSIKTAAQDGSFGR